MLFRYAKFQNKMNKDIYLTNSLGSKKEKFKSHSKESEFQKIL